MVGINLSIIFTNKYEYVYYISVIITKKVIKGGYFALKKCIFWVSTKIERWRDSKIQKLKHNFCVDLIYECQKKKILKKKHRKLREVLILLLNFEWRQHGEFLKIDDGELCFHKIFALASLKR